MKESTNAIEDQLSAEIEENKKQETEKEESNFQVPIKGSVKWEKEKKPVRCST